MRRPRKAIVLAAGYGTRLRPLSNAIPKPMMPLLGKPIIEHTIDLLESWGVRDILINLHYLPGPIVNFLRNRKGHVRIQFSFEPEILGTGGAIRKAEWFIDKEPFWIINADIAADVSPKPLITEFERRRPLAALWLHPHLPPRTVEMQKGRITNFASRSPGKQGTYTFCGLHLVSPALLKYLPQSGSSSIIDAYRLAMKGAKRISGVVVDHSFWSDLGTPGRYLGAHADMVRYTSASGRAPAPGIPMTVLKPLPAFAEALKSLKWDAADAAAEPLPVRGSDRSFTRISSGDRSAILIQYGTERRENARYAGHARFLRKQGIHVPRVLGDRPGLRATVIEDLGDNSLLSAVTGRRAVEKRYKTALDQLLMLHSIRPSALTRAGIRLERPFTVELYRWEHELMAEHLLKNGFALSRRQINPILDELATVSRRLLAAPRVLLHRDMQSSNIMIHNGKPYFVDFQGMRLGPAAYDLASLLCDPYVMLSAAAQDRLLRYYVSRSPKQEAITDFFWHAAVQRLAQALGAFGRLGSDHGTRGFTQYICPGLAMMKRALGHVEGLPRLRRMIEGQLG